MKKKGLSNIEIVLAFVIFVGAVMFGIYYFSSEYRQPAGESEIVYLTNQIVEGYSSKTEIVSVILDESIPVSKEIIAINPERTIENGEEVAIYNLSEDRLPTKIINGVVYINKSKSGKVLSMRISRGITSEYYDIGSVPALNQSEYTLGSERSESLLSENMLKEMNESYYNGYSSLKSSLGLGQNFDFTVEIDFDGRKIIMSRESPAGISIYSKTARMSMLGRDGKIKFGDMKIKIW